MNSTSFLDSDDSDISLQVILDIVSGLFNSSSESVLKTPELLISPSNNVKKTVQVKTPTIPSQKSSSLEDSDLLVNMKTLMEEQLQEIMSSAEFLHERSEALNIKTDGIHQEVLVYRDKLRKRKGEVYERMSQVTNLISPSKRPKLDMEAGKHSGQFSRY